MNLTQVVKQNECESLAKAIDMHIEHNSSFFGFKQIHPESYKGGTSFICRQVVKLLEEGM